MKHLEILAPAGNMESLIGAINAGANAVYLAGKRFGARAFANNFSDEEIIEVIHYAHLRGVFVYITINTIIFNDEIDDFLSYTDFLVNQHIDALIIQDLGMMYLLRKRYPNLSLHASTQANIHDVDQAKFLKEIGINRIILARETPLSMIKKIKKEVDIELEVFVQGALCVSYSGNCLMSSMLQQRSGNRGECAQSCRMPYALLKDGQKITDQSYLLSTKDLMTLDYLEELVSLSIDSIKIEGRMKKSEYVIQAVLTYRHAYDAIINKQKNSFYDQDLDQLKRIFNRKFTKGFMFEELPRDINYDERPNHLGVELGVVIAYHKNKVKIKLSDSLSVNDGYRIFGENDYGDRVSRILKNHELVKTAYANDVIELDVKEAVEVGSNVVKTTDGELVQKLSIYLNPHFKSQKLQGIVKAYQGQKLMLEIKHQDMMISMESDQILEEALNNPSSKEMIYDQISKLGNTPFFFEELIVDTDQKSFIPVKTMNQLRRDVIDLLEMKKVRRIKPKIVTTLTTDPMVLTYDSNISYKVSSQSQYDELAKDENIHLIYEEKLKPDLLRKNQSMMKRRIQIKQGKEIHASVYVHEVGSIYQHQKKFPLCTTEFFNVTNIYTAYMLFYYGASKVTLSLELSKDRIASFVSLYLNKFGHLPHLEMLIYGKIELMISKYCPIAKTYKTKPDCLLCEKNKYALKDNRSRTFDLLHDGACNIRILSDQTLDLTKELEYLRQVGIQSFRVDFTTESNEMMRQVIHKLLSKKPIEPTYKTFQGRYFI